MKGKNITGNQPTEAPPVETILIQRMGNQGIRSEGYFKIIGISPKDRLKLIKGKTIEVPKTAFKQLTGIKIITQEIKETST